jgi:hypothetical protein
MAFAQLLSVYWDLGIAVVVLVGHFLLDMTTWGHQRPRVPLFFFFFLKIFSLSFSLPLYSGTLTWGPQPTWHVDRYTAGRCRRLNDVICCDLLGECKVYLCRPFWTSSVLIYQNGTAPLTVAENDVTSTVPWQDNLDKASITCIIMLTRMHFLCLF